MITLFYKTCRLLTYVILAFIAIMVGTKMLPVIGRGINSVKNTATSVTRSVSRSVSEIEHKIRK